MNTSIRRLISLMKSKRRTGGTWMTSASMNWRSVRARYLPVLMLIHLVQVGGGLAAGLGLLGAGYYAYKHHEKSGEEVSNYPGSDSQDSTKCSSQKKAQVWGLQGWLTDAQRRTQEFYQNGPQGPVTWVLVQDKHVPEGAFPAGEVDGEPLYVCRAFHEVSMAFDM